MPDLKDFRSGRWETQHKGELTEYRSFLPSLIDQEWYSTDPRVNRLESDAMYALGSLNSLAMRIPDVDVYIKMHIKAEANTSSRIEGTRTTLEEDLLPIEEVAPEKRNDHQEVSNYVRAITYGIEELQKPNGLPLCNRFLRNCHKILMDSVRGENKTPGEFRRSQNWLGGGSINTASYVPPSEQAVGELMSDFEQFINSEYELVSPLLKAAVLHYQFETIHPFLDGNGRIGRLMIPLVLLNEKILRKPCFYISSYLENRRAEYYSALQMTREKNDLLSWYQFFLKAVKTTADSAVGKFQRVMDYVEQMNRYVKSLEKRNTGNIDRVIQAYFSEPTLAAADLAQKLELSPPTVNAILNELTRDGILNEVTGASRNRVYQMTEYIRLFQDPAY